MTFTLEKGNEGNGDGEAEAKDTTGNEIAQIRRKENS